MTFKFCEHTIPTVQNKQAIIGIATAVIILLGAGGVFLYSKTGSRQSVQNTPSPTKAQKQELKTGNSIIGILKLGQTQQCSFKSEEEDISTSGIVYLDKKNLRADLTITEDNKKSAISMIRKGDDNYIWGTSFPNNAGVKMTLSADEFAKDEDTKDYFDPNKKVDYNCKPWIADSGMFNPPSNIKFQNLSEMMKGLISPNASQSTQSSSSSCSVCNSLTGDSKTACLTSLNCQ